MNLISFLKLFPKVEPPVTITDESIFAFSKNNKMINTETAATIMSQFESDFDEEEDREYIPCFQLAISKEFHSLVYWRASALNYEYFLINIDKKGKLMDRRFIGGLVAQDNTLMRMYVSIDVNYIFYIAAQMTEDDKESLDAIDAQTYSLEILPDGSIITS